MDSPRKVGEGLQVFIIKILYLYIVDCGSDLYVTDCGEQTLIWERGQGDTPNYYRGVR